MTKTLIRDASIVTMDEAIGDLATGSILIEDDRILEVGARIDVADDVEVIDGTDRIAMPGFVNAHIHTWQTGLRGVAADWTISQYLRAMHAGLAGYFRPDDIQIANCFTHTPVTAGDSDAHNSGRGRQVLFQRLGVLRRNRQFEALRLIRMHLDRLQDVVFNFFAKSR